MRHFVDDMRPIYDSDDPIQLSDNDRLCFLPYVCALYELIDNRLREDASFSIAIFGDWGTGKTSLMRMLQNELAKEPDKFLTLYFDAWAFEEFDNLFPPLILELTKLAGENKDVLKIGQDIAEQIMRVAVARATEGEVLWDDIKEQASKIFSSEVREIKKYDYKKKLWDLITRITEGHKTLVIFIDDLDRVRPPSKAIELLEDLQLLMDFPHVIYVIAANRRLLMRGLSESYLIGLASDKGISKIPAWSEKYIEKFFQLSITLPVLQGSTLQNLNYKKYKTDEDRLKKLKNEVRKIGLLKKYGFVIRRFLGHYLRWMKSLDDILYLILISAWTYWFDNHLLCSLDPTTCLKTYNEVFWALFPISLLGATIGALIFYPLIQFIKEVLTPKVTYIKGKLIPKWEKKLEKAILSGAYKVGFVRLAILKLYSFTVKRTRNKKTGNKRCNEHKLSYSDQYEVNVIELLRNQRKFIRYKNLRLFYTDLITRVRNRAEEFGIYFDNDKLLSRWIALISSWPIILEKRKFQEILEIEKALDAPKDLKNIFNTVREKFKNMLRDVELDEEFLDRFTKFWINTSYQSKFRSLREIISYAYPVEFCFEQEKYNQQRTRKGLHFDDESLMINRLVRDKKSIKEGFSSVLSHIFLNNMKLGKANFDGIVFVQGNDFSLSHFDGSSFKNSVMSGTNFKDSSLVRVDFSGSILDGVDFHNSNIESANFTGAKYIFAKFLNARGIDRAKLNPCQVAIALRAQYQELSDNDRKKLKEMFLKWLRRCQLQS